MKNDPFIPSPSNPSERSQARDSYGELEASELYCPQCGRAVPVRKFLLLVLPDGDRYEYRCRFCGTKVGKKTSHSGQFYQVLKGRPY